MCRHNIQDIVMFLSTLCSDMEKILSGIGDKLALFVQWITAFFGGFIVGFWREWRLTLLLMGFTPFLAISGAVFAKVCYHVHVGMNHLLWSTALT